MKERMKMLCSADGGYDLVKDYAFLSLVSFFWMTDHDAAGGYLILGCYGQIFPFFSVND